MVKRNWSLWLALIVSLGLILGFQIIQTLVRDERISIEDSRLPDLVIEPAVNQNTAYVWTDEIELSIDEKLYDAHAYDGTAYYVVALNQLREQYAYSYRLYRFGTETEYLTELPDAKPHRLHIEAADANIILFTKEYSDGRTALISYNISTGQINQIHDWQGRPRDAAISYHNNTIGLIVDNAWYVYNVLGQLRQVEYEFPAGAIIRALGPGSNELFIYYEVDELRYLCHYQFLNKNSTTFLVNDRIQRIYRQTGWAVTQSENSLQLYTWPELKVQRLMVEELVDTVEVISHELIDIRLKNEPSHHVVVDVSQRTVRYNQVIDPDSFDDRNAFHFFMPAVHRINIILFEQ